jgi:hypothetical protein
MTLLAWRFPEKGLSEFGVCTNSCLIPESLKVTTICQALSSVLLHNCLDNWVRTIKDVVKVCMAAAVRAAACGTLRRGLLQGDYGKSYAVVESVLTLLCTAPRH